MKRFTDLTAEQQGRAVEESLRRVLNAITEGGLRFNDFANGNDLQARIDRARELTGENAVLWPARVMDDCSEELARLAVMAARDAVYSEGETIISLEDL